MTAAAVSALDSQSAVPLKPLPAIQLETERDARLDGPRFSLGFSRPTPIANVLLLLVRDTRLSVVPDPGLNQRFVGDLRNVTLREALDLILEPLGLDYAVRGQVIRVFPRELETRLFSIDHVITQRTGRRTLGGATEITSTDAPDLYSDLDAAIRALLSSEGRVNVDRTAALLQVTDRASRLARVEQYLEAVMHRAMRQVQIDAKVVEIELRDPASSGIDWSAVMRALPRSGATPPRTPSSVPLALAGTAPNAVLDALAAQGTVRVRSNAVVPAMNNQPAMMRVGMQAAQGSADGVALSVTPLVAADGLIHMSVSASVTRRTGDEPAPGGAPPVLVREADTIVRVGQGDTVLMTGLVHETTDADRTRRKTDLIILLTPTLVEPQVAAR
jgi:type II secretory pathway component GspD/PulD (secretin)